MMFVVKKSSYVLLVVLFSSFLLTACSGPEEDDGKKDFFVQTIYVWDQWSSTYMVKPWRVVWSQDIMVSSQVNGRVSRILFKDGDGVLGGQPIVSLADTTVNYWLQVEQAKNALDRAILTYEQNKNNLDLQLNQARLAVEQARNAFGVSTRSADLALRRSDLDISNVDVGINSLKLQLAVQRSNVIGILDSVLYQSDVILWVSPSYAHMNDAFEILLSAKDSSQKNRAETMLQSLYRLYRDVEDMETSDLSEEELFQWVELLAKAYDDAGNMVAQMIRVLENSVSAVNFPQAQIDGYMAAFGWLRANVQQSKVAFTAYRTQILSLLVPQWTWFVDSTRTNIQIWYDTAILNTDNAIFNSELALKTAQNNLDTLKKNYDNQLALLNNAVWSARIAYQNAMSQYNKLDVRSPIAGVIWSVLVDVGQEVVMWVPLFTVSSKNSQLIEVFVNSDEYNYVSVWQEVMVYSSRDSVSGSVSSVSSVADRNMLYKVTVELLSGLDILWTTANVYIPLNMWNNVLPVNSVIVTAPNRWFVYILSWWELDRYFVDIARVWGSFVELSSVLPENTDVIISDVSNYDSQEFVIRRKMD